MWYCCEFISILQELGEIEEESGIKKSIHSPCNISHGPNNLHSITYTTTDATVSTYRHTVRVTPYTDRVRRFWKTVSDLERSFIEGRSVQLLYRRDSHLQTDVFEERK